MTTIGLVLQNTSKVSETFFISKIKILQELGYEVIVFTNKDQENLKCGVILNPKIDKNIFFLLPRMIISYLILFFRCPIIFIQFLKIEKSEGVYFIERWKNLYLNSNILKQKLTWLHFGFSTNAIRRENVAKAIGAKMGVSIRGYDICIYPLINPSCYNNLWNKVDKIHSISKDLLQTAKDQGLPNNIEQVVINPAINTKYFRPKKKNKKNTIKSNKINFLTIARLHWKKGIDHTLRALAILKEDNIDFNYIVIGEGQERERLIFSINQFGLTEDVTLLGSVPHRETRDYYNNADIYIQYSLQEGFCNSVLEAQAMGLLTIVSNAEGLSENVIDGHTGWVVPKREPKLLAKQIKEVLNYDYSIKKDIQEQAQTRVKEHFNLIEQKRAFSKFFN